MSSLGIFNKETQSYQKIAGSTGAAMLDTEMSDTSVNPVQNKVIKKYVDSKQVEVNVASKDKAGIVKPTDGLVVAEDGSLKVNLDGTTLTMDQVNNVIKLADTLKEKISGALPAANVVNNLTTTEAGFALDARQANPNVDGTIAKQLSALSAIVNTHPDIVWSGTQTMSLAAANAWQASDIFMRLQPGTYVLGFKAHTNCKDDVYIDTSIDTKDNTFIYYEKNVNMPVSTKIATGGSSAARSVTNTFVARVTEPVDLYFLCWSDHLIDLTYEIWSLKLY